MTFFDHVVWQWYKYIKIINAIDLLWNFIIKVLRILKYYYD